MKASAAHGAHTCRAGRLLLRRRQAGVRPAGRWVWWRWRSCGRRTRLLLTSGAACIAHARACLADRRNSHARVLASGACDSSTHTLRHTLWRCRCCWCHSSALLRARAWQSPRPQPPQPAWRGQAVGARRRSGGAVQLHCPHPPDAHLAGDSQARWQHQERVWLRSTTVSRRANRISLNPSCRSGAHRVWQLSLNGAVALLQQEAAAACSQHTLHCVTLATVDRSDSEWCGVSRRGPGGGKNCKLIWSLSVTSTGQDDAAGTRRRHATAGAGACWVCVPPGAQLPHAHSNQPSTHLQAGEHLQPPQQQLLQSGRFFYRDGATYEGQYKALGGLQQPAPDAPAAPAAAAAAKKGVSKKSKEEEAAAAQPAEPPKPVRQGTGARVCVQHTSHPSAASARARSASRTRGGAASCRHVHVWRLLVHRRVGRR
jgi:hypothetical protein